MKQKSLNHLSACDLHNWLNKGDDKPLVIDVREDEELALAPFSHQVLHLPLSKSQEWIENLSKRFSRNQPLVVICHAGIRSLNFGNWLVSQNWGCEVWNLEGGIDAWSQEIDPSVPRY